MCVHAFKLPTGSYGVFRHADAHCCGAIHAGTILRCYSAEFGCAHHWSRVNQYCWGRGVRKCQSSLFPESEGSRFKRSLHDNAGEDSKSLVEGQLYSFEVSVFLSRFLLLLFPSNSFFFHIKSSKPLSYQNQHYLV